MFFARPGTELRALIRNDVTTLVLYRIKVEPNLKKYNKYNIQRCDKRPDLRKNPTFYDRGSLRTAVVKYSQHKQVHFQIKLFHNFSPNVSQHFWC